GQLVVNAHAFLGDHFLALGVDHVFAQLAAHQALVVGSQLVDHAAIGGLDKAVVIDAGKGGQITDQANVGAFRSFNGANAAVVRIVHVTHIEAGALTAQTARTEGRDAAF